MRKENLSFNLIDNTDKENIGIISERIIEATGLKSLFVLMAIISVYLCIRWGLDWRVNNTVLFISVCLFLSGVLVIVIGKLLVAHSIKSVVMKSLKLRGDEIVLSEESVDSLEEKLVLPYSSVKRIILQPDKIAVQLITKKGKMIVASFNSNDKSSKVRQQFLRTMGDH